MDLGIIALGHTFEGVQQFANRRGRLIRLLASNAEHILDWFHIWRSHATPQELDALHQERQRGLISEVSKKTRLGNAPQHTPTAFARATVILPRFRSRTLTKHHMFGVAQTPMWISYSLRTGSMNKMRV